MKLFRFKNPYTKVYTIARISEFNVVDEILFEGHPRFRGFFLFGLFLTFVPPFVLGPLVMWYGWLIAKRSKTIITKDRFITLEYLFGSELQVTEFPLEKFENIFPLPDPINVLRRFFFGQSKLRFGYRDDDGTLWYTLHRAYGDTRFIRRLKSSLGKTHAG